MKGLLRKDYLTIRLLFWIYLIMSLFFWFGFSISHHLMDGTFVVSLFYPALLMGMLPISLMTQDETDHWEQFAGTLPFSRAQLVSSKFCITLLLGAFSTALMLVAFTVGFCVSPPFDWSLLFLSALSYFSYLLLTSGVTLLLAFKFGTYKSRFIGLILIGGTSGLFFSLGFRLSAWSMAMLPISILLFLLCWFFSIRVYAKRDL